MAKRSTHTSGEPDRPDNPARVGLADAIRSLREATRGLSESADRSIASPEPGPRPEQASSRSSAPASEEAATTDRPARTEAAPDEDEEEARAFYQRLEQTGQLVDVTRDADLAQLPPRITHVRWPDGKIERVGYSASPFRQP
jgi:hypothetical protein